MTDPLPPEVLRELESAPAEVLAKFRAALRIMRHQQVAGAIGLRLERDGAGRQRLKVVAMENIDPESVEAAVVDNGV